MKTRSLNYRRLTLGFTLIELLVVIAIIAILAAMLFPAIGVAKRKAAEASARAQMQNIALALGRYEADYNGRFPAPGVSAGAIDVTYGYAGGTSIPGVVTNFISNSNVIAILLDLEYTKESPPQPTANVGHVLNPRRVSNLNGNFSSGDNADPLSGIGRDLVYRDPWGNPYVISMDTSLDERTHDSLYSRSAVSKDKPPANSQKGYYGLFNPTTGGNTDQYAHNGKFMIWSLGADGKADINQDAKTGVNKDNLLSWQE